MVEPRAADDLAAENRQDDRAFHDAAGETQPSRADVFFHHTDLGGTQQRRLEADQEERQDRRRQGLEVQRCREATQRAELHPGCPADDEGFRETIRQPARGGREQHVGKNQTDDDHVLDAIKRLMDRKQPRRQSDQYELGDVHVERLKNLERYQRPERGPFPPGRLFQVVFLHVGREATRFGPGRNSKLARLSGGVRLRA